MDNQFPMMVYKAGGPHEIHGGRFDYLIVQDAAGLEAAIASGWATSTDATGAAPAPQDDGAPATRAELERKAAELGIKFDGRTSDAKLAGKIADALKG